MNLIAVPRYSEKSFAQAKDNVYTFDVPLDANKITVKKAIEEQFGVKVISVNINKVSGKVKKTVRKRGRQVMGKRSDYKKAYVAVAEGQSISVFASAQEEDKA